MRTKAHAPSRKNASRSGKADEETRMREDVFVFPALERLIYGKPAAAALAGEVERIGGRRVFLVVSGTMNRTTDEVEKVQAALGSRYAGKYDAIPPFNPRSAVLKAAEHARAVDTDL